MCLFRFFLSIFVCMYNPPPLSPDIFLEQDFVVAKIVCGADRVPHGGGNSRPPSPSLKTTAHSSLFTKIYTWWATCLSVRALARSLLLVLLSSRVIVRVTRFKKRECPLLFHFCFFFVFFSTIRVVHASNEPRRLGRHKRRICGILKYIR